MTTFIAACLVHAWRVTAAAGVMLLIGLTLWVGGGVVTGVLGVQTPTMVLVCVGSAALAAFVGGGYIFARFITPKSLLHPAIAGAALVLMYGIVFTSGDSTPIDVALIAAGAVLATAGAALGRAAD